MDCKEETCEQADNETNIEYKITDRDERKRDEANTKQDAPKRAVDTAAGLPEGCNFVPDQRHAGNCQRYAKHNL